MPTQDGRGCCTAADVARYRIRLGHDCATALRELENMMLSCRLRWYALATSRLLRRHWQALTLSILLLLPAMPVFAQTRILGAPVLAALAPSHGMQWRFVWVHMLEAVGMVWVLAQRGAITGGAFASFLDSVEGWIFVFLVLTVAAAEVVVGLAIIVSIFRSRRDINIDELDSMKG